MFNNHIALYSSIGSHVGESLNEIIVRKIKEIKEFGFTTWALSYNTKNRITLINEEINKTNKSLIVLGCGGSTTTDPQTKKR